MQLRAVVILAALCGCTDTQIVVQVNSVHGPFESVEVEVSGATIPTTEISIGENVEPPFSFTLVPAHDRDVDRTIRVRGINSSMESFSATANASFEADSRVFVSLSLGEPGVDAGDAGDAGAGDAGDVGHASVDSGDASVDSGDASVDSGTDACVPMEERCNDRDDDCDGRVDEEASDFIDYYEDFDRDSFGAGEVRRGCEVPAGFVENNEDCDDFNSSASPELAETACNAIDDDCDASVDETTECIPGCAGFTFEGRGYIHCPTRRSWNDARQICNQDEIRPIPYELVTINSSEENDFVARMVTEPSWIGINDRAAEGDFVWVEGRSDFLNWGARQPDNELGGEDCGEIRVGEGDWNDGSCVQERHFVCEATR